MMSIVDVHAILAMAPPGVMFWIDGGWGVDALLGRQSREHIDLDLNYLADDRVTVLDHWRAAGFSKVNTPWSSPDHSLWADSEQCSIDVRFHSAVPELTTGVIGGRGVRCITATAQIAAHAGKTESKDLADVSALREHLAL